MAFSPDDGQLVYVAYPAGLDHGGAVLMTGTKELSPRLLYIQQPKFSPDGSRLAYQGSSGEKKQGVMAYSRMEFVMVGNRRVTPLFRDSVGFRFFSNRRLAFAGYDAASQCLLHGEMELE